MSGDGIYSNDKGMFIVYNTMAETLDEFPLGHKFLGIH